MLSLKRISKRYKKNQIFNDAQLKISTPGLYLLKGANGSGKTTLLNIIGGYTSYAGEVSGECKKSISYTFQNNYLIEFLTIREHFVLFNINVDLLKEYGLYEKLECYPSSLSLGQKQRIAIILSIYSENNLILLDEPFANLDEDNYQLFFSLIKQSSSEKIIILIDHKCKSYAEYNGVITIKDKKIKYKDLKNNTRKLKVTKVKHQKSKVYSKKSFKFHYKEYMKVYLLSSICFFLMLSFSLAQYLFNQKINQDILYSVDYNKYHLKSCKEFSSGGFLVTKCHNPNKEQLTLLDEAQINYGLNYDAFLNFLYKRDDLATMDHSSLILKKGKYPSKGSEVIANEEYEIGDKIELDGDLLLSDLKVDLYQKKLEVEVVGIYHELNFLKDHNIYFDYKYVDDFFKSEILVNNNLSLYEYFNSLEIENYKYISFDRLDIKEITFEGLKKELYTSIEEIYFKILDIIKYFKILIMIFLVYNLYRTCTIIFVYKQKSFAFLIAQSWNKNSVFLHEMKFFYLFYFSLLLLCSLIYYLVCLNLTFILELFMIVSLLILSVTLNGCRFFSRKNVAKLMGEQKW